jgi:hypothetical protein
MSLTWRVHHFVCIEGQDDRTKRIAGTKDGMIVFGQGVFDVDLYGAQRKTRKFVSQSKGWKLLLLFS